MKSHILALAGLGVAACASQSGISEVWQGVVKRQCGVSFVTYPKDFLHSEELRASWNYWNASTGQSLFYDGGAVDTEPAESIVKIQVQPGKMYYKGKEVCGKTDYLVRLPDGCITCQVIVLSGYCLNHSSAAGIETVIRHELGHALGFVHAESANGLMYEETALYRSEPKDLSEEELMDVLSVYGN